MPLTLLPSEPSSFDGGYYKTLTVHGPLTLIRLCGKNAAGEASDRYGRFWFNEKFFWNTLDVISNSVDNAVQLNHYLRFVLREFSGVCYDWNTFASIYQFNLPARHSVDVAVGRIACQPFYSSSDPQHRKSLPHELLVGGDFQYIVDLYANPTLKQFVRGPLPMQVQRTGRA